ncbi:Glycoside Hydrolase Family 17 protein [Tuber magnatum]|uniref:Probable beta-glucosidase btgE n=1 Tax=Tuber magnatum TaxID=42249 RepID=A0A317SD88_9PEZI|nr:Glycoside Hydrolase Family 17 protein [Tuber magnatum]
MRYSLLALAASAWLSSSVSARGHQHRRHAHPAGLAPHGECEVVPPQCTTYTSSVLVPIGTVPPSDASTLKQTMTVVPVVEPTTTTKTTRTSTATLTNVVTLTKPSSAASTSAPPVPTPIVTVCPTPGTYTIPANTVVITSTETVCVPETTMLPPGTHTFGGVTTVVHTATTVVCPVAAVETAGGVTTSKVVMTTYVCPTAGTYVIGASTSTVTGTVTVPCTYPVPTAYPPGTYTHPEVVTTVTVTSAVVVCPYTSSGLPTSAPAVPTTAPSAPLTTTPSAPASTVSATPVSSSAAPSSSVSTAKPSSGGDLWAITYSPYSGNGGCKTASEVSADITTIASKGFKNIRLYSSDCDGLKNVGSACEASGLGIILGVFIKAGGVSTADEQVKDILAWKKFNLVVLFVVGNEAVFNGYCSAEELAAYILKVKGQLQGAGYTGHVTTAETLNILQAHGSVICSAVDVTGVNVHPFFNPGVTADKAGEFLKGQLKLASEACGGKPGWVLEAGWPSAGQPNGNAVPGASEQKVAIASIVKESPGQVTYFSFENDLWKAAGAFGVEPNFGCSGLF